MSWPTTGPAPLTPRQYKALRKAAMHLLEPLGPPLLFSHEPGFGNLLISPPSGPSTYFTEEETADFHAAMSIIAEFQPAPPPPGP